MTNAFRELAKQKPAFEEKDPKQCVANDCPCRASMNFGSGWTCSAHGIVPADRWPTVTRGLRDYLWLSEFIDTMRTMDARCEDWRGFAIQFWTNTDEWCKPVEGENAVPYQNRMRGEMLYRSGAAACRPQIRLPKPRQARGIFSRLPEERQAA